MIKIDQNTDGMYEARFYNGKSYGDPILMHKEFQVVSNAILFVSVYGWSDIVKKVFDRWGIIY